MTQSQKQENVRFFQSIINLTKDGGSYLYPGVSQLYTVSNGNLIGTKKGIKILKKITSKDFHKNLIIG